MPDSSSRGMANPSPRLLACWASIAPRSTGRLAHVRPRRDHEAAKVAEDWTEALRPGDAPEVGGPLNIETSRLILGRPTVQDVPRLFEFLGDAVAMQYTHADASLQ